MTVSEPTLEIGFSTFRSLCAKEQGWLREDIAQVCRIHCLVDELGGCNIKIIHGMFPTGNFWGINTMHIRWINEFILSI
jgi:hypothetical protein